MKTKRITALALCLVMLSSLLPAAALAEDGLPEEELILEEELELLPEPELIPEDPPEEPDALPSLPEELPEELSEELMLLVGETYGEEGELSITLDYNYDNKPPKTLRVASPYTPPNITREDHTLLGWSTSPDGPDYYTVGTAITLTDGMTLYAIWDGTYCRVTLEYD